MKRQTSAEEQILFETSAEVSVTGTFDSMGLKEDLLRGIYAFGSAISPHCASFI